MMDASGVQHKWLWMTLKILGLYLPPRSVAHILFCSTMFIFIEFYRRIILSWYRMRTVPDYNADVAHMTFYLKMTWVYIECLLGTCLVLIIIPFYMSYGKLERTWMGSLLELRRIGIQYDTAGKQWKFGLMLTALTVVTMVVPLATCFMKQDPQQLWIRVSIGWSTIKYSVILDPLFCYFAKDVANLLKTISDAVRAGSCTPSQAVYAVSVVEDNVRILNDVFGKNRLLVILFNLYNFIYTIYWLIFEASTEPFQFTMLVALPFSFTWLLLCCSLGERIKYEV